jgi:PAS domain S-box-containing protein
MKNSMSDMSGQITVLHVDDDAGFTDLSETLLEERSKQLQVETATGPEAVLDDISAWEYDCVVSDYDMPEVDGIEFLEAIRAEWSTLPVIVFTGKGSEEVAAEAISAGATDYIQKRGETSQFTVLANRIENVVEQHRARQSAERANQRRQRTLERITDGYVELDDEMVVTEVNEQAERLIGHSREELLGTPYDELSSEGRLETLSEYRDVLDKQEAKTVESESDINPGRWYRERIFPAQDSEGIFVYFRDITERREQKRALEEKTQQLEAILNNVKSAIWMRDSESRFLLINENCREMFGIPSDTDMTGKTPETLFGDRLAGQFKTNDRAPLDAGESVEFEEEVQTKDGNRTFLTRITPLFEDGEVYATVGVATDITAQKRQAREHEESRQLYRTLLDQSPNGVVIVQDETIQFVNDRMCVLTGKDDTELRGQRFTEIIAPEYHELVETRYESRVDGDQPPENYEIEMTAEDGQHRVIDLSASRIQYEGRPAVLATFNDLTEIKRHERQLEALKDEYESVFEHTDETLFLLDEEGDTLKVKRLAEPVVGEDGSTRPDALSEISDAKLKTEYQECVARNRKTTYTEQVSQSGRRTWEVVLTPIAIEGRVDRVVGTARNVTRQRRREELQKRIIDISSELIGTSKEEVDDRIETALARIGEYEGADRSYIFEFTDDGDVMDNTHEWCAPGVDSQQATLQGLDTGDFSWFMPKIVDQQTVTVPDVDDLPPEATHLQQTLDAGKIDAIVTVPLTRHDETIGFIGFDWTDATAPWTDETLGLMEVSAHIIASALTQKETVARREEREETLSALHDAATEIGRAESEAEVYETVTATAERILEFDLVAIDVERDGELIQEAWSLEMNGGDYYESTSLEDDDTFAGRAYNHQEAILVDDLREYDITPADNDYRSVLTIPIGTFGTFQTVSTSVAAFDEYDREFAELLVDHAAVKLRQLTDKDQLREQKEELKEQNERLDAFTSIVSHDLRNPLNTLELSLDLAERTGDTEHFERSYRAISRMDRLLEELLTLAHQGDDLGDLESVSLRQAVEQAWETVETGEAELLLAEDLTLKADRVRLMQLLENLISNAVEHGTTATSPEYSTVCITVGTLDGGFYVADDGPGVPAGEDIFEMGYSTAEDGTGFGLAIVEEIVDAHGWAIRVTESDGGGARFEITGVKA